MQKRGSKATVEDLKWDGQVIYQCALLKVEMLTEKQNVIKHLLMVLIKKYIRY